MIGVVMIMIRLGFRAQFWYLREEGMNYGRIAWLWDKELGFGVLDGVVGKD